MPIQQLFSIKPESIIKFSFGYAANRSFSELGRNVEYILHSNCVWVYVCALHVCMYVFGVFVCEFCVYVCVLCVRDSYT